MADKIKDIAKNELRRRYEEYMRVMYPHVPLYALPPVPNCFSKLSTTNGLTQATILLIQLKGWQAERVSSSGRVIDKSKNVTDVLGRTKRIGSSQYIPSTSTNGTADISATIGGKSVKIEVKNSKTRDKLSAAQKKYKAMIEATGGVYWIVGTFDEAFTLIEQYEDNPNKKQLWRLKK